MTSSVKRTALALAALLGVGTMQARADQINVFNTGVAADGSTLLAPGAVDPNYTITQAGALNPSDTTAPATPFVVNHAYPIMPYGPFWASEAPTPGAADTSSQWVSTVATGEGPSGYTTYQTTFNLNGLDPSTAKITGLWGVDNLGQIFLNGQHVAGQDIVASQTATGAPLFPFTIDSGFHAGVNTLDFQVWNDNYGFAANVTGLRVSISSATADPMSPTQAPEPSTLALGGMAVIGLLVHQRRRRSLPA